MANKELLGLSEYLGTITDDTPIYILSPDGDSRYVKASRLKTYANTDPTTVPSSTPFRGARVYLTADFTLPNNSSSVVTWAAAARDTDSFWAGGAPTRLTIGPGISKVQLFATVRYAAHATGARQSHIHRNGSSIITGGGLMATPGMATVTTTHSLHTDVIDVVEDDYFELSAFQSSGGNLNLVHDSGAHMWFSIVVVEASV